MHATELAASVASTYFLDYLVTRYGTDPEVTRALDTRAFYICPRVNPDGPEWALADKPKFIRSSTRAYPFDEDAIEGLTIEDIDGDGRILQMRIPDANGLWKSHPDEPRLMVRREPVEVGGTYYRLVPEGTVEAYDGFTLKIKKAKQGLDLNRNYPSHWRQEFDQVGAGPYPDFGARSPRAASQFLTVHPNISGGVSFHTWTGVLLRPFDHSPDSDMPAEDLWTYQKIGKQGTELTGYPAISVYHEFRYHPKQVIGGTVGLALRAPGRVSLGRRDMESHARGRDRQVSVHRLVPRASDRRTTSSSIAGTSKRWAGRRTSTGSRSTTRNSARSRSAAGTGFNAFSNPPPQFLEREVARFPKWLLWQALHLAQARAGSRRRATARRRHVEDQSWSYRIQDWLPSYVSASARSSTRSCAESRRDRVADRRRAWYRASAVKISDSSKEKPTSTPESPSGRTTT